MGWQDAPEEKTTGSSPAWMSAPEEGYRGEGISSPQTKNSVERIVSAISPENTEKQQGGFLDRLYSGTKEMFSPSMEGIKRLFNPNAGQFGPSRVLEQEGQRLGGVVRRSAQNIGESISESKFGQNNPRVAAIPGAIVGALADTISTSLTPSSAQQSLGAEAIGITGRVAGEAIKDSKAATDADRRALGFQKKDIYNSKSPFESMRKLALANRTAKEMLERGGISVTGSTEASLKNAVDILGEGSGNINKVVDAVDSAGVKIQPDVLGNKIIDELNPKLPEQQKIVEKILNDIQETYPNGLTISEAKRTLKKYWGGKGYDMTTVGSEAASLYRKAADVIGNLIHETIKNNVSPEMLSLYAEGNKNYSTGINALRGLANASAAEAGNNLVSPTSIMLGVGELASGNVPGAFAAAGGTEFLKRRGAALTANAIYGFGESLSGTRNFGGLSTLFKSANTAISPIPKKQKEQKSDVMPGKGFIQSLTNKKRDIPTMDEKDVHDFVIDAPAGTRFRFNGSDKIYKVVPRKERTYFPDEQSKKDYEKSRRFLGAYRTKTFTLA